MTESWKKQKNPVFFQEVILLAPQAKLRPNTAASATEKTLAPRLAAPLAGVVDVAGAPPVVVAAPPDDVAGAPVPEDPGDVAVGEEAAAAPVGVPKSVPSVGTGPMPAEAEAPTPTRAPIPCPEGPWKARAFF